MTLPTSLAPASIICGTLFSLLLSNSRRLTLICACRVPMGYWSFIDIPDVPYINAGELNQLERVLEIAQPMGLYTVLVGF